MPSARFRSALCLLLCLLTLCALLPCARAEEPASSAEVLWPSAEAAIRDLLEEYEVDESCVALGYYNTVTGEEYYLNPDMYLDAASMYKVPLNMYYAELVANGELDPDGYIGEIPYSTLRDETIINSDNDKAAVLIAQFNGYQNYRRAIAPYMGVDPDNVDAKYYENNYFTPRQMIACLKLLYSEPERFPGVLETMEKAEPDNYFCRDEHRYTIAHKYGWNEDDNYVLHINDCAVIPTPDPIIIVCFTTSGITRQMDFLTAYCTRCIDYTESAAEAREAEEEAERQAREAAEKQAEEAARQAAEAEAQSGATADETQSLTGASAGSAQQEPATTPDIGSAGRRMAVILGISALVCVASLILFFVRLRARSYGALLPLVACGLAGLAALIFACRLLF